MNTNLIKFADYVKANSSQCTDSILESVTALLESVFEEEKPTDIRPMVTWSPEIEFISESYSLDEISKDLESTQWGITLDDSVKSESQQVKPLKHILQKTNEADIVKVIKEMIALDQINKGMHNVGELDFVKGALKYFMDLGDQKVLSELKEVSSSSTSNADIAKGIKEIIFGHPDRLIEFVKYSNMFEIWTDGEGLEITPKTYLKYSNFQNDFKDIVKMCSKYDAEFNESCGAHIHVGLNVNYNLYPSDIIRLLVNYYNRRDQFRALYGREIEDNMYIYMIERDFDAIMDAVRSGESLVKLSAFNAHEGEINISSIADRYNTIEFRGASGELWNEPAELYSLYEKIIEFVIDTVNCTRVVNLGEGYQLQYLKSEGSLHTFIVFDNGKYSHTLSIPFAMPRSKYERVTNRYDELKDTTDKVELEERQTLLNKIQKRRE